MKTILCIALSLVCGISYGEESDRIAMIRRGMQSYVWDTSSVTFEEVGKNGQPVIIKRDGKAVGYYCDELVWERKDVQEPALDGITRIVYGYEDRGAPILFQIDDPAEIAVWVAAYKNHTEFEHQFGCFIPTSKSAGFELKREEIEFGCVCLCSLALRFLAGETKILTLKGHIQDHSEIDSGMRNFVLHELAKAKLPQKPSKPEGGDPLIDPFAEESASQPPEANQSGAGQPATPPQSKTEGGDQPQPEAEGRSR